ncbi:MAG: PD40 domain-containing protein, partial [Gemmatimonadetes bacterium]|nr:PD40 domain-containing protein [Gemmatimonadota bacterium]
IKMLRDPAAGGDAIKAIEVVTGVKKDQLSTDWREAVASMYRVSAGARIPPLAATASFDKDAGGRVNVGTALSPDGKNIAFMSERGGLSLDLYLADAATGKIIRKLLSTATDPHFDSLQFLNSAGSFSPDGTRLALGTVRKGYPALAILRVSDGSIEREYAQPTLGEIFQPTWSPDGRSIAFSAQANGVTDLFVMTTADGALRRLTNDAFSDLHPAWSPDGTRIAFVTDRFSAGGAAPGRYELASIAPAGGNSTRISTGLDGNAANPQWTDQGRTLLFISDADGRPNVYALSDGAAARQLTGVATGVSGFTPLTPALAAASNAQVSAVTIFHDGGFDIHVVQTPAGVPASAQPSGGPRDSALPPLNRTGGEVERMLTPATPLAPAAV